MSGKKNTEAERAGRPPQRDSDPGSDPESDPGRSDALADAGAARDQPRTDQPRPLTRDVAHMGAGYARFAGVGIHFAVTILLFAYGGYRLDLWLDSSPWFLLLGVFVGFLGAMISLVSKVKKVTASAASRKPRKLRRARSTAPEPHSEPQPEHDS